MTDDPVLDVVLDVIGEETGNAPADITSDMTANDVPGWDSLAHVRIILEIAARLGISMDIERTYRAATIGDLAALYRKASAGR